MSLDTFVVQTPNKGVGSTTDNLIVEEFTGLVKGTVDRMSALDGFIPFQPMKGTDTITSNAIGESTLGVLQPGVTPNGTKNDFGKIKLTVDTPLFARASFTLIDIWRTSFDARAKVAQEQGKKLAKQRDLALFTQAIKAALATQSAYANGVSGAPAGHFGGSQTTLASSGAASDPAAVYAAIAKLFAAMEKKDVDPRADNVLLALGVDTYYTLLQAEQLVNTTYVTAQGTKVENTMVLKAYGVPVINSNNFPGGKTITGSLLSNAANGNAYDGDFTKVLAVAFSAESLLAGELSSLQSDVFFDKVSKHWFADSWQSYGVTQDRNEYAGAILLP
jgi:hypothetical protein